MKCKNTSKLIIDKLAGELSTKQDFKLKKHLAECEACRKEYEQFSKLWELTGETLKEDSFAEELSPARKSEIFGIASKKNKPGFLSFKINRIVEYGIAACIIFMLAGMLLPALNQSREKARRISAASIKKQEELEKMMVEMDAEEAAEKDVFEESPEFADEKDDYFGYDQGQTTNERQLYAPQKLKSVRLGGTILNTRKSSSSLDSDAMSAPAAPALAMQKEIRAKRYNAPVSAKPVELKRLKISKKEAVQKDKSWAMACTASEKKKTQVRKIFRDIDLKLWNLTKTETVKKFLMDNNCSEQVGIWIYRSKNKIIISGSEANMKKVEKLFNQLKEEQQELKDLRKGLPFIKTSSRPISTFSIDTDTASYVQARKSIMRGIRPDPLKIRPEEFINYFDYNYRSPHNSTFAVYPEAAASPFRPENTLFRIGIQGKRLGPDTQTKNNYIILLDASGSMAVKDRMELARKALKMLFSKLKDTDLVSLMLCGEKTTMVAKHRPLFKSNREWLLRTMDQIAPHGVADFAEGISQAYTFADKYYIPNNSNRIIIISDGIFEIKNGKRPMIFSKIEDARKRGISNIVIGLGGDGDDETLEKVASTGDGSYVFLDTEREAEELFNSQFEARFREIARDVKIQVQFNKDAVKSYRQIGYKNRQLSAADFRNDKVDAGEVGSGQSVTSLYELKLNENITKDTIVATIRIRYKKAEDMSIEEKVFYLFGNDIKENFANASANFKLAALVAEFSEALRYPETQDIASTRGIADKLNALKMKDFSKSMKVSELLTLIKKSK